MNMRSAARPDPSARSDPPRGASGPPDDRSARTRIRDAALAAFAERGFRATTVRQVAEDAGVSPALVIHHFGSKERLREACDAFVAAHVRELKTAAMRAGPGLDPLSLLRSEDARLPLLAYLARALHDGAPTAATLVDEMVADAEGYLADGVASGALRPVGDLRGVATVLTLWSLGALVLHEHVRRLLGVDLTAPPSAAHLQGAYTRAAMEVLTHGVVDPAFLERMTAGAAGAPGDDRRHEEEETA